MARGTTKGFIFGFVDRRQERRGILELHIETSVEEEYMFIPLGKKWWSNTRGKGMTMKNVQERCRKVGMSKDRIIDVREREKFPRLVRGHRILTQSLRARSLGARARRDDLSRPHRSTRERISSKGPEANAIGQGASCKTEYFRAGRGIKWAAQRGTKRMAEILENAPYVGRGHHNLWQIPVRQSLL